ncbi:hypothetical protein DFH09DRAFT_1100775 [Mycena vulgaris]|nr:hypothetical protein DFH09DRAFT_1100775 [Mycena vulgaris]
MYRPDHTVAVDWNAIKLGEAKKSCHLQWSHREIRDSEAEGKGKGSEMKRAEAESGRSRDCDGLHVLGCREILCGGKFKRHLGRSTKCSRKEDVDDVQKWRGTSASVDCDETGLLVARKPTGGVPEKKGRGARCYLWVFALHWPRGWWYDGEIARSFPVYDTNR